jgi:hypothetical protein
MKKKRKRKKQRKKERTETKEEKIRESPSNYHFIINVTVSHDAIK